MDFPLILACWWNT